MFKLKYSPKFYLGAVLFVASLIIGKITLTTFIVYYGSPTIRWASLIIYILSWPMLIIGVWWVGKEYAKALNKYFTYKFYHKSLKERTKRAYHGTRRIHSKVRERTEKTAKKLHSTVKGKLRKKGK